MFHAFLGLFIGKIRFGIARLSPGLVVTMTVLALAGRQFPITAAVEWRNWHRGLCSCEWSCALVVILFYDGGQVFTRGICCHFRGADRIDRGYVYAHGRPGMLSFGGISGFYVTRSAAFALPNPLEIRVRFRPQRSRLLDGVHLRRLKLGDSRRDHQRRPRAAKADDSEIQARPYATGSGQAVAEHLWWPAANNIVQPETSGVIAMTLFMTAMSVTIGAFLDVCGLVPKVGGVIRYQFRSRVLAAGSS